MSAHAKKKLPRLGKGKTRPDGPKADDSKLSMARANRSRPAGPRLVPPISHAAAPAGEPAAEGFQTRMQVEVTICVLLAIATFAVYFRATQNPFVNYDDQGYVVENAHVQQGLTRDTVRWALTSTYATNWHPLTWLSHALDCQLFGLNAPGHHLTSVLLHVLNTLLIFLLLSRATGARLRSLAVAALFGLHPINVESVAWIAERKNVLCMFFILLTLAAYGWYARRPRVDRYLAVAGLFVLALAAKPMAVTLPFALLLVDFWPLQRVNSLQPAEAFPVPQASLWRLALERIPLVLLSAASSVITMIAQKAAVATNESVALPVRLVNAVYAYTMYVVKAFFPVRLASFYPYEGYRLSDARLLLCVVFLVCVTFWAWRKRALMYLPAGWLWFLGTLVPMIGVVQVGDQAMADRYAYLPLLGIFVMVVWGVGDVVEKRKLDLRIWVGATAAIVVALSIGTWRQIGFWNSSRDLWFHALAVTKDNYMAEDYAGSALLADHFEATGERRLEEAAVHFQNAVRINPNDAISHLNLGADEHERGLYRKAIQQYRAVLALTQDQHLDVKALSDLGAASQQLGDYAAASEYYHQARQLEPDNDTIFMNIGRLGMMERMQELSAETSAKPTPQGYLELGQLQQAVGLALDARRSFEAAIKLNPKFAEARKALEGLAAPARQ
ncbi:MAG TPA: tetratricopeptide repeat protein [Candidatus Sulfotelmatobacter sp.]|nr:tetratricopeptide repeat protein [Candidatus Sulfotelmatobacter sp.]